MKPLIRRVYLLSFCSLSTALPEFSACSRPEEVVPVSCFVVAFWGGGGVGGGWFEPPATRRGNGIIEEIMGEGRGEERSW